MVAVSSDEPPGRRRRTDLRDAAARRWWRTAFGPLAAAVPLLLPACSGSLQEPRDRLDCNVSTAQIAQRAGGGNGVSALTNPPLVRFGLPGALYLSGSDRVIGIVLEGEPIAVPHNILWWHEVVNFELPGTRVAVSYSPSTGSGLAFDLRAAEVGNFGVSGFVFNGNLMMEDPETGSLWTQMLKGASCGRRKGAGLQVVPTLETTWGGWRQLYPQTRVVSSVTGHELPYTLYPFGSYEDLENAETMFPVERVDTRRPPKERVLGIPSGTGGVAFPFGALRDAIVQGSGGLAAANVSLDGEPVVVFWSSFLGGAVAYRARVGVNTVTFRAAEGGLRDLETNSAWTLAGNSTAGQLAGTQLEPITEAHVAFWFAWALFQPDTEIWAGEG